jgi:hypothetical protein
MMTVIVHALDLATLINVQWQRQKCSDTVLQRLMHSHDSYNHAYKKYIARNKSAHYVASRKLLSYVGFIRYYSHSISYRS